LARLSGVPDVHKLDFVDDARPVAPVPAAFRDVRFRYPRAQHDAVGPVTLTVERGEHLAITGANGSGKTTLMLLLSGREPTAGTLERPGAVGLGRFGGTAVVMQHPESQVLGTRVVDDVVWGLPPGVTVDVDRLLGEVGLDGLGERDTGGLSGGELQRLAVAAALAREPALLIADEVTSMVDQKGRDGLVSILSGLTKHHDMSLVHITHYNDEADSADRTINLTGNLDNVEMVTTAPAPSATAAPVHHAGDPMLELRGVSHEYSRGTPWASTALRDIDFVVHEGDGLLIHGLNGSGKSTLAWIMAGLLAPTAGSCLLDGESVSDQVGAIAISFQAARLQLMRGRVDLEIASAAGFDYHNHRRVEHALATVGLDPALGLRRIDQLSGGQMRRVVLAGLLARSPRAIILDEPLAGLDVASRRGLLTLLEDLRRNTGLTVIVISHDFSGLQELCPRTLHLHDGALTPVPTIAGGAS
jgi:energy-coupling factor transport system ATP-binding protein